MSSTNRNAIRNANDYYITPKEHIKLFWDNFTTHNNIDPNSKVLDSSAGGDPNHPDMPYPTVLQPHFNNPIETVDIRQDSSANIKKSYLGLTFEIDYDIIISNPPFDLAMEFIQKALKDVKMDGYVIMLLRLNFFGSKKRYAFLQNNMPVQCYVHSKRMGFNPQYPNKTDSIEYAHFVWQSNNLITQDNTTLRVIR